MPKAISSKGLQNWTGCGTRGKSGGRKKKTDKRKHKRKASKSDNTPAIVSQETSIKMENTIEVATVSMTNDDASTAVPNDRSSLSFKMSNGSFASQSSLANGKMENNSSLVKNTSALFHSLCYSEDVLSALPNRTWAIHSSEVPEKRIVISAMIMFNSNGIGLTPVYVKQIIFDERLNFDVLLVNSRIVLKDKPNMIRTMHDFEDLLDYVDGLKVCAGGPPVSKYNNLNPECAYRDSMNNWRHNLCTLEISFGEVCDSCRSLDEILRRHAQRVRTPSKSRSASKKK